MPDQNAAAREHALLQEITAPLDSLPEDPVQFTADVEFPVVLRGYDRIAVDAYVRRTSQMVAELQARTSPQAAIRRALERVGEEVASILQRAHETAAEITSQSRREAEDRLQLARVEARRLTDDAQRRVSELDADADRVWEERERILGDARELARQLTELADAAAARFAPQSEAESGASDGGPQATETSETEAIGNDETPAAAEHYQDTQPFEPPAIGGDLDAELQPGQYAEVHRGEGADVELDAEVEPDADIEPGEYAEAEPDEAAWSDQVEEDEPLDAPTVAIEPPDHERPPQAGEMFEGPEPGVEASEPQTGSVPFDFEADGGKLPGTLGFEDPPGESIAARHNLGSPKP